MIRRRRYLKLTALFLILVLFVAACTRPFERPEVDPDLAATPAAVDDTSDAGQPPDSSADQPAEGDGDATDEGETAVDEPEATDGEVAEGEAQTGEGEATDGDAETTPAAEGEGEAEATDEAATDGEAAEATPTAEGEAAEGEAEATPAAEGEGEATDDEVAEGEATPTTEDAEAAADEEAVAEGEGEATEEGADAAAETSQEPAASHTVQPGENLYRIGLQYGVSWVSIARLNDITNPDRIVVGQVLKLPGSDDGGPTPTPSPTDEVIYTVRPGDTLFRIGLQFELTWDQIAEANGIVNPNQIYAGQELKIPTAAPGPSPQFMHTVMPGDTLYELSVRYGVTTRAIAEANRLNAPFIIYPGQMLIIPGE